MLEIPDAAPTSAAGTDAVAAADAHPLDRPSPTAIATSGSTNSPYDQELLVNPNAPRPTVATSEPTSTTARDPSRAARPLTNGATTTIPAAAGSVASPACSGDMPSPA